MATGQATSKPSQAGASHRSALLSASCHQTYCTSHTLACKCTLHHACIVGTPRFCVQFSRQLHSVLSLCSRWKPLPLSSPLPLARCPNRSCVVSKCSSVVAKLVKNFKASYAKLTCEENTLGIIYLLYMNHGHHQQHQHQELCDGNIVQVAPCSGHDSLQCACILLSAINCTNCAVGADP